MMRLYVATVIFVCTFAGFANSRARAGMPSPLPTHWTKQNPQLGSELPSAQSGSNDARWQAISFFVACLLLSAWAVKRLWMSLRESIPWLPVLDYRRSLSLVVLWGLLFVIVLTMISGARELMTPGAWRKQGWTYKLNETVPPPKPPADSFVDRTNALKQLRFALWQYAATHEGRFPGREDQTIDPELWDIPGYPGLRFLNVPGLTAEDTGRLLVFEPEIEGDMRQVLLTNGQISSMRTNEIQQQLRTEPTP